ncbi:MAG: ribonuclease Y, partial [Deinococcus sp.]
EHSEAMADVQREQTERGRECEALKADRQEAKRERDELKREIERLNRRAEQLDARGDKLDLLEERLEAQERALAGTEGHLQERLRAADLKLYEVAELSPEAAREQILSKLDGELEEEKAIRVRAMQERASSEAKRHARQVITQAIQRSAAETSAALSVSVIPIPSDAMKGRLIGREGRNIRAFENLTGVDLIIDDTPEAVILSSFNPVRREVARHVLEALIQDGRIHPSRIEEMVHKAQDDMKTFIHGQGEEAASSAGVLGLKPGLVQLLGRMYFRSSYGQNVLKHSVQVAHLTGLMAAELGLDVTLARRAGLMHDVGKSIDREIEGTHVDIGVSLGRRFGEPHEVIDAIGHHHDPENGETLYSVLVAAADAISAARPGARREELEGYIKRLENLEHIAVSFPGVQQAYAVQAGREVRVLVQPDKVSDAQAALLAREIASRVEQDMEYPGQVQVTVVRESRAVEIAK